MSWESLLDGNKQWVKTRTATDPEFFVRTAGTHQPKVMFLGCSDARVPVNLVTSTDVGEVFVHRNVANQVQPSDASFDAGLQYAVDVLEVEDVVVCGHRCCGGVQASLGDGVPGRVEAWIAPLRLLARVHRAELEALPEDERVGRLVELNVAEQVTQLARHPTVRAAWKRGRPLRLHGWVYDLHEGALVPYLRVEPGGEVVELRPEVVAAK